MKTLTEFINESVNESRLDNFFFKIYKSKTLEEFKERLLDLKSNINTQKVATSKSGKYYTIMPENKQIPAYTISSVSPTDFYIAIWVDDEFPDKAHLYFGNAKRFLEFKWNSKFNDVGWDNFRGGAKKALLRTDEVYIMPDEYIADCKAELKNMK